MYKVTSEGIVKQGKEWELTQADRFELMSSILSLTSPPTVSKRHGMWSQRHPNDIMESGYRVFEPGEDKEDKEGYAETYEYMTKFMEGEEWTS
jgi:hypothetical protein